MHTEICIWMVDDQVGFLDLFSQLLGVEMGIEPPKKFCSAPAMLTALENQPAPDVILMDDQMPEMSGIEAIPHVHQLAPNTRVIIITSFHDGVNRQIALANGAANFLRKGCLLAKIVEAIHSALRPPTPTTGPDATRHGEVEGRL